MSLRVRIRLLALGATVAVLVLFSIPLWVLESRSASQDVEDSATETALGVADYLSAAGVSDDLTDYVARVNDREDASQVEVITADGTTYGPALPGADEQASATRGDADQDGDDSGDVDGDRDGPFLRQSQVDVDDVTGGRLVRVEVRTGGGPTVVLGYADDAQVRSTLAARLFPLGVAALLLLVVIGAAAELVARRLVTDLDRTADLADTIAAGDAVARVPESGPPEVRRVAHALNGLAGRIDELLAAERETAADLSHRLRTPLTALRLDVEALPEGESRSELEDHVNTLERTLTAIIHQARRSGREGTRVGCRPGPVVAESVAYWQPLIEDQDREVEVAVTPDLPEVHASVDDLRAAIDALVENCIAHTPDHTAIAVRAFETSSDSRRVVVEVRDQGPGFGADAVRRGRSDRGSTGLGLDIARRCARASGGELVVTREEPWTVVQLRLGLA
ncbi:MAG TPA: HAMP domain-containing sensor histidine kinase [Nocardioides sp.]|uniref:sensor histidine kinase n=1 Tax=Nocardioides sp. TaxID=35761 RepID=UPI002E3573C7|nr:HAMP domain-containing sensor histidine kinase [Nocardioides sp.]HEX5087108.1 HAMP domain-containing sensor histidine kinase [Nocardioides sp.]